MTQHNRTNFIAPHRLGLFTLLIAPRNPNLTFHNDSIRVLEGSWKDPGRVLEGFRPIRSYWPDQFRPIRANLFLARLSYPTFSSSLDVFPLIYCTFLTTSGHWRRCVSWVGIKGIINKKSLAVYDVLQHWLHYIYC